MPRSVRGSDGVQGPHAGLVKVGTLPPRNVRFGRSQRLLSAGCDVCCGSKTARGRTRRKDQGAAHQSSHWRTGMCRPSLGSEQVFQFDLALARIPEQNCV